MESFEFCDCEESGSEDHHKGKVINSTTNHNLYLSNIPKNVGEDEVKIHFSQYGKILSVHIREKKAGREKLCGFVNFKEAESMSRALKSQPHIFGTHRITVKAADSWKQLEITKLEVNFSDQTSENIRVDENSILRLNDDCLLHIFSFLSLKEQLKLSALCERFQSIFEIIFRCKKSINNKKKSLTFLEVNQMITQVGHHIEEAHLEGNDDENPENYSRCLELMSHSCPNLQWLELSEFYRVHPDTYRLISLSLKNLAKVELKGSSFTDQAIGHLSHLPELEYLDVSGNDDLTGMFLARLPKLARLNLSQCSNIEPKHFSELCKKRQLKSLNINYCSKLDRSNFIEMESMLDNLENLVISPHYKNGARDIYRIAGLKNLKELTIRECPKNIINIFKSLARRKANTLETLVIIAYRCVLSKRQKEYICSLKGLKKLGIHRAKALDHIFLRQIASLPQLTSLNLANSEILRTGLAALFEKSNNLQHIDISNCDDIGEQAIFDIAEKIKESKRTSPCTLYVMNTNIPCYIMDEEKYMEVAKLLPLSYKFYELWLRVDPVFTYTHYDSFSEEFKYDYYSFSDEALNNQPHVFGAHRITVNAADSWKRSAITKLQANSSDQAFVLDACLEENHVKENSILRLNDDCLLHIFSFLPLNKQFQLSALCKRFQSIFEMIFRIKKSLNSARGNLKLVEVAQIITQVGHHIEEAHLQRYRCHSAINRCLEFMSHSCPNLRWLELLAVWYVDPDTYRLISLNLKNLTKVSLRKCFITDIALNHLSHLPELESLDLSGNNELTGMFLARFQKLARLNLSRCSNIEPQHYSELCKKRQLKSLNINHCFQLDKSNFMEMESLLDNLENLTMSSVVYDTDDLLHIAGLKNLKELTIRACARNLEDLFESLAKRKGNTLETLVLFTKHGDNLTKRQKECICSLKSLKKLGIYRDPEMDDIFLRQIATLPQLTSLDLAGSVISRTGLSALFEESNNLQHVDISNCHQICAQAIFDILERIKKSKRTSACTLYIGNTSIPNKIIMDEKYLECAKLLPLSFKICELGLRVNPIFTAGDSSSEDSFGEDSSSEDSF